MANTITQQVNDNMLRNAMPAIGGAAISAGGYGGSRQGVLEANALRDANQSASNALTNMYYGDYNNAMQRQLQKYGMDQQNKLGWAGIDLQNRGLDNSFALGMGNLGLGYQNSMQNFYTAQRGQDLQQTALGANIFGQGVNGLMNQGQGLYNLGLTQQQAPWQTLTGFNNSASPYTGFGSTTGTQPGNMLGGAMGGALIGGQAYKAWKGNAGEVMYGGGG